MNINQLKETYIKELPTQMVKSIQFELKKLGLNEADTERGLCGVLSDLEYTIDITPFLHELAAIQAKTFEGTLFIGDTALAEEYPQYIFQQSLQHMFDLHVEEKDEIVYVRLHFYKEKAFMQWNGQEISYPSNMCITDNRSLGCDTAAFLLMGNERGCTVRTLSDGQYGHAVTLNDGQEHMILLFLTTDAISAQNMEQTILYILKGK